MRVIICGDTHIGAVFGLGGPNGTGGNTRIDDYEKSLNFIVDYAINTKADAFVQTGDLFDSRTPSPEHITIVDRALKKLSAANIMSAVMMGNHDYKRTGTGFTSAISTLAAKDFPNVRIVLEPQVFNVASTNNKRCNLLLIPYRDRRMYGGKNTKEDSELYEKEVEELIETCSPDPIVAVGHNFFFDGSYNDYGGSEVLIRPSAFVKCDLVAMGHYHQFKIIKKSSPITIYTGSMERINFGDADVEKYFIDFCTDTKKTKVVKIPVRDLLDFELDLTDCNLETLNDCLEERLNKFDLKQKIVRTKIIIKESFASSVKKSMIEKKLYERGAYYVSKINIDQVYQKIVRDVSILKEKDELSMFRAFLESQEFSKEYKELLLTEAKHIIGA